MGRRHSGTMSLHVTTHNTLGLGMNEGWEYRRPSHSQGPPCAGRHWNQAQTSNGRSRSVSNCPTGSRKVRGVRNGSKQIVWEGKGSLGPNHLVNGRSTAHKAVQQSQAQPSYTGGRGPVGALGGSTQTAGKMSTMARPQARATTTGKPILG